MMPGVQLNDGESFILELFLRDAGHIGVSKAIGLCMISFKTGQYQCTLMHVYLVICPVLPVFNEINSWKCMYRIAD